MNYLVLITARIGSKRLKFKNIKYLKGFRIFEYTIRFALNNFDSHKILVSTDSSLIKKKMEKFTILCPWLRPSNLSKASTTSYETVLHAISWYERVYEKLDMIILLQPTSPYRNKFTLKRALCLYEKYPQYNIKTIKKDISQTGRKKILINSKTFQPNGNFYIFPRENLNSEKLFLNKNKYIFVKDKKENIDIDTINDFENANKLL